MIAHSVFVLSRWKMSKIRLFCCLHEKWKMSITHAILIPWMASANTWLQQRILTVWKWIARLIDLSLILQFLSSTKWSGPLCVVLFRGADRSSCRAAQSQCGLEKVKCCFSLTVNLWDVSAWSHAAPYMQLNEVFVHFSQAMMVGKNSNNRNGFVQWFSWKESERTWS